jgi:hypothetical protein
VQHISANAQLDPMCRLLHQALLERFEFFPVKCRVQRALEIAQIEKEKAGDSQQITFKTKAWPRAPSQKMFMRGIPVFYRNYSKRNLSIHECILFS